MATSGTFNFNPSVAEIVAQAYARLQIFPPQLTQQHIADARFAMNLLLSDWSGLRGVNLASVDQIQIALMPGQISYPVPGNTVDLLDVYLRTYSEGSTSVTIGNALVPVGPPGNPILATPYGDPAVVQPDSTTLSCTAGSQYITLNWPAHGQAVGDPLFWGCPISIGGLAISGFSIVTAVVDSNTLQFLAPSAALETRTNVGATPLFFTTNGSSSMSCLQPGHGLSAGDSFTVPIATTVGGIPLSGTYTVVAVQAPYQFSFASGGTAAADDAVFENSGQLNITPQSPTVPYTDVPLFPLSRNDYAVLPVKSVAGRPTSFWLDRIVPPVLSIYPTVATGGFLYGFIAYRMREIEDALAVSGQTPDLPRRMWPAFVAALTAAVAEIYRPEAWEQKKQAAEMAWTRAASADTERAILHIVPSFQSYFR